MAVPYQFRCQLCGCEKLFKFKMGDASDFIVGEEHEDDQGNYCQGAFERVFTIPGMRVFHVDEWNLRMPGEVHRDRRTLEDSE